MNTIIDDITAARINRALPSIASPKRDDTR